MLKKAYLEITNVCNLNCSFCRGNAREKGFISVESFRAAAEQLRRHTDYLYLHLMGEPLLHPQLEELLAVCADLRFHTVSASPTAQDLCPRMELKHDSG